MSDIEDRNLSSHYETTVRPVWKPKSDNISNPAHYTHSKYETWDVIEEWSLNYNLGNVVKYISRADHKGNKVQDLMKARAYLTREIEKLEGKK